MRRWHDVPWDGCGDCAITERQVNSEHTDGADVAMAANGSFVMSRFPAQH